MKKVESFSCDHSNGKGEDIFKYLRDIYETDNLHNNGYVTLVNSSSLYGDDYNRTDISTIIGDEDGKRWVSEEEENAYFTIDFHSNSVLLNGYSIKTSPERRFMKSWDVYGIEHNNKEVLIDRQEERIICEPDSYNFCSVTTVTAFRSQKPGLYHKFKFKLTGRDSLGNYQLSLSKLKFYGTINPHVLCQTIQYSPKFPFALNVYTIIILF